LTRRPPAPPNAVNVALLALGESKATLVALPAARAAERSQRGVALLALGESKATLVALPAARAAERSQRGVALLALGESKATLVALPADGRSKVRLAATPTP
jgi:hypothetical protein